MHAIPRRFRRPDAQLRIEPEKTTPPDDSSGGVVRLRATLLPLEQFRVRCGRLDLTLAITFFARTVLDGYHEHTSEWTYRSVVLCEDVAAPTGQPLIYCMELALPDTSRLDLSRPSRLHWLAKARFEVYGCRALSATLPLRDVTPPDGGSPMVDGSGFLPLYEFRTGTDT